MFLEENSTWTIVPPKQLFHPLFAGPAGGEEDVDDLLRQAAAYAAAAGAAHKRRRRRGSASRPRRCAPFVPPPSVRRGRAGGGRRRAEYNYDKIRGIVNQLKTNQGFVVNHLFIAKRLCLFKIISVIKKSSLKKHVLLK